ncbi:MAG: type IV-A pilus assembly ATPase PilB [Deltaproteobacteria bacterium]|nr:MAG: type IV-A pilus assembly ATPase PilB [Deltaproteobacteria bacterium]
MAINLGEELVKSNLLTRDQLQKALQELKQSGGSLRSALVKLDYIDEDNLLQFLSELYHIPIIKLDGIQIPEEVLKLVPERIAKKYIVLPVERQGPKLTVAVADPSNLILAEEIEFITGYNVNIKLCSELELIQTIKRAYGGGGAIAGKGVTNIDVKDYTLEDIEEDNPVFLDDDPDTIDVDDFDALVTGAIDNVQIVDESGREGGAVDLTNEIDAPVIKLVNGILIKAIKGGASDIHFEPYERQFRVRYRIDGVLRKVMGLPVKIKNAIISRLKIMAQLDIAERRLPQDGRIKLRLGRAKEVDFRVSTVPTLYGEKVVLRLLDKSSLQLDMTKLGFEDDDLELFQNAIHQPVGMVLVTGPTGSGKTTTLYSALIDLNRESDNIMTAEDPIEYNFAGINQVQMHEEIGLTFASSLRSFLRQDPDIIMVGEIRDFETAQISIQAALTGHLVLSTLHTNDAPSAITRLIDMGIEPFLVTSSVILVQAQRLMRRICEHCKEPVKIPEEALIEAGVPKEKIGTFECYKGKGCPYCNHTGYKGRVSVFEIMPYFEELKSMTLKRASGFELKKRAIELGMRTLRQNALLKVMNGISTLEEALRVTVED